MCLYFHFLSFILQPLNEFNTTFQADESRIGFLSQEMTILLRKFLGKFVKARVIQTSEELTAVDYTNPDNQLHDNILAIGISTRVYLVDNTDSIPPSVVTNFFKSARKFYAAVVGKMINKFPFNDPVVNGLAFLNPTSRGDVPSSAVTAIATRFPAIVPATQLQQLEDEFTDYQVSPALDLPIYEPGKTRVDEYWGKVLELKNKITDSPRFPLLSKIVSASLTIPNSNADCERTFSMVKKIQTDTRSSLEHSTLSCLLTTKINNTTTCYNFKPTKDQLKLAKQACSTYNKDCNED